MSLRGTAAWFALKFAIFPGLLNGFGVSAFSRPNFFDMVPSVQVRRCSTIRPAGILAFIRESVTHKDTWPGCKFTLSEITGAGRAAGFEIVDSHYVTA
jgi:hypothetical protein